MTTDQKTTATDLQRLNENISRVEALSQRLVAAMATKKQIDPGLHAPSHEVYFKAASAYMNTMVQNPAKVMEHQVSYWGKMLKHYVDAQHVLTSGKLAAPQDPTPKDRRFSNPMWDTHPYFNYVKQNYLLTSQAIGEALDDLDGLEKDDRKRVQYFTQQIIDMFAPNNFLATNPDALERAVETNGQSLVDGLENLVKDIEENSGELVVTLADKSAFTVGENLAMTPGSVVYRNRMFELIQYTPTTETVDQVPLVVFPPWINKFYVLDMKEQNSFIKWVVDQGITLFVVSWVNPDTSYAGVGMDEYLDEGYVEAITQVKAITGQPQVNAVGYCIGGTTLSLAAAVLDKRGDKSLKSVTLFTTLTDFSDQGEMSVFLDNDFVDGIEREAVETGMLSSFIMARTFSYLRSNDLIYGPAIKSYMMGQAPPAFDLLYWNGDSTNLPGKMAVEYLRGLCQQNRFATTGFSIGGESVTLKDVKVPVCAIACETDHIAAWKASYAGLRQFGSRSKTFLLSQSGHVAGIVNPPSKKKYGHYTKTGMTVEADAWFDGATLNEGSWWPRWREWLSKRAGKQVPARDPGSDTHPVLAAAPGTYVLNQRST
ncbi:class I poly(R)-hydroxyalkanoic acid synthase [Pseudoruegeria sp. SK021]|uniref:class I poly(R)-hydroxyalkanoic acid synthase n=1 Tax=Pseudoruegeria sp. SK021 TaxID=1933035 RepID=UPI000A25AB5B|nr:class I poly(R)-hydroxyalkanoic acid synthase [Pseudoruegeria sp. SK021]OSP54258.1 class I poly(R)-hydroxyalkanoic acid synthase [Pseudoruegeria sp. SK021]